MSSGPVPDLHQHPYEHRRPQRPRHLPRRVEPPPERGAPPDLTLFLYVGLGLVAVLAVVAVPYAVAYLIRWVTGG
ncbi:MAG: hypothetical protein M3O93_06890 [Chloroflexota bacterium]|nr:hypothetical protein [Chloroflexota bacterium]